MNRKSFLHVFISFWIFASNAVYAGADAGSIASAEIVDNMLAEYQSAYPDIQFVHLEDGLDSDRLDKIYAALGEDAENVDYEHPSALRSTLLVAHRRRIEIMLDEGLPSATLFRSGAQSDVQKGYVCVVTLDTTHFSGGPGAATGLLSVGFELETGAKLKNEQFLRFTIDHELFHCLDAYLNGPTRPRTGSYINASYNDYRAEQRADLYAGFAHQARESGDEGFLHTLAMYRTLAILELDVEHFSAPLLLKIMRIDPSFSAGLSLVARVGFAMAVADRWLLTADEYRDFVASAAIVAMENDRKLVASPMFQELSGTGGPPDEQIIRELRRSLHRARRHIAARS